MEKCPFILYTIPQYEFENIIFRTTQKALKELLQIEGSKKAEDKIQEEILDQKSAAAYLKISTVTLLKYVRQGYLKAGKLGSRRRFKKSDLEKCLQNKSR